MLALTFDGGLRLATDVPAPAPVPGEALVRVSLAGICGTDLEITRGYKGFSGVLGHEFVGDVVEARDSSWIGLRVCGEINVACGRCMECTRNRRTHCRDRSVVGILGRQGAFAEYIALPVENLHPVPAPVSDEEAVFVEPLAAAFQILEQVEIHPADRVAVLGDGRLGLLCAQVLRLTGAQVLLVGKHPSKLAIVGGLGIETRLVDEAPGDQDIVVDTTGSATGLRMALDLVRPRGTVVLKSTVAAEVTQDLSLIPVKEITVVGSRCGPFPLAIEALLHRRIQVLPLITGRFPLTQGIEAMEAAASSGAVKVLMDISPHSPLR